MRSPKYNERFRNPVYKYTRLCQNPTVYKCDAGITNHDMIKRFKGYNKLKTTDRLKTMVESPEFIELDDSKAGAEKAKFKAERFCVKQIFSAVQKLLLFEQAKLDTSGDVTEHRGTMSEFYCNCLILENSVVKEWCQTTVAVNGKKLNPKYCGMCGTELSSVLRI